HGFRELIAPGGMSDSREVERDETRQTHIPLLMRQCLRSLSSCCRLFEPPEIAENEFEIHKGTRSDMVQVHSLSRHDNLSQRALRQLECAHVTKQGAHVHANAERSSNVS